MLKNWIKIMVSPRPFLRFFFFFVSNLTVISLDAIRSQKSHFELKYFSFSFIQIVLRKSVLHKISLLLDHLSINSLTLETELRKWRMFMIPQSATVTFVKFVFNISMMSRLQHLMEKKLRLQLEILYKSFTTMS